MYMARMGQETVLRVLAIEPATTYPLEWMPTRRKGHATCTLSQQFDRSLKPFVAPPKFTLWLELEDSAAIRRFLVSKLSCFSKNVWSFEIALQRTGVNRKIDRHKPVTPQF